MTQVSITDAGHSAMPRMTFCPFGSCGDPGLVIGSVPPIIDGKDTSDGTTRMHLTRISFVMDPSGVVRARGL